jgi:glycosyltransferase involved in cell wall biosynthesis
MVSVIIPNYNHCNYLKLRLDSVFNQTYQDFEVIILDDASNDESIELIEQYRTHPKLSHIVYNEINSGTTFIQWKKGIDLANGEFIWIAESDDFASLNFIEKLLPYLESDKDLSIVFSDSNVINEKGEKIEDTQWHRVTAWGKLADLIEKYVTKGKEIGVEGKLVHRSYDDKDGIKRYITEVVINDILLLSK